MLAAIAACGRHTDPPAPAPASRPAASAPAAAAGWTCEQLPFELTTPVPEASGAAWLTIDGKRVLVVVGDSGQHGAYGLIDPDTGKTLEQGRLPLGGGGDDLEGLASRGDRLYGLASNGWLRVWQRDGDKFVLVDGPYPIGEGDMVCDQDRFNCARNYEGLCLAPAPGSCTGYAASKADGTLYCLVEKAGRLHVQRDGAIPVTRPKVLADCTYGDDGALWAGGNIFGLGQVYRIDDGKPVPVAQLGPANPEVLALRGDTVYRMSDTNSAPSLMAKFRCRPPTR